ncbi:uncharacterized protein LOC106062710 isoform X1 [Biomphalaria glabrata]|uniref:Uncharacterized protein LOC106062710 isoform X1 n=1 Tax=Biomphalaria glabrata TaxID=6526 RepID=A0A9W2ZFJ8_BIOGL|nr:uncharacterized protein LOC106062710 isoform X1 [Biomphalaria glabrata]
MMNTYILLKLHLWITLVESQIVNQTSVGEMESLTVRCDIQKFKKQDYPECTYVNSIAVERMPPGEVSFTYMAKYSPFAATEEHKKITNIPAGRQWDIVFLGDDSDDNRDTIGIVIVIKNGNYRDAGLYRCYYIDHLNRKKYTDPFFLRPKALGKVANKGSIVPGDTLTVQCDWEKFNRKTSPRWIYIDNLVAERRVTGDNDFRLIARYKPFVPEGPDKRITSIPTGRQWEINFVSGDTQNCKDYSITIYIKDVAVSDAGRYRCTYYDYDTNALIESDPFTVLPPQDSRIVDKESVGTNEVFTVTCDIQKFGENDYPESNQVKGMTTERKLSGADSYEIMARFAPFDTTEDKKREIKTPPGRQWNVQFSGSDTNTNRDTIKLVIVVNDGSYTDVGLYRCSYLAEDYSIHYSDAVYLRAGDTLESQIVNKNSVGQNDMLTVVCDVKKFKPEDYPDYPYLNSLTAEWKPAGQDSFSEIAKSFPFNHDEASKHVMKIPPGRSWEIDFIGDVADNNRDSIKIVIVMKDATYSDAGIYRCNYMDYIRTYYSYNQSLVAKPKQPRVNMDIVRPGATFEVQCDILKFSQKGNYLAIQRKLAGSSEYVPMALYCPYSTDSAIKSFVPPGRQWKVDIIDESVIDIQLTVQDGDCYDAGDYRCMHSSAFDEDRLNVYSESFNLKSEETFVPDSIKITLPDGMDPSSLELEENYMNVTCTYHGPPILETVWSFLDRGPPQLHNYKVTVLPATKILDNKNCQVTLHKTQMTYYPSPERDEWTFVCSVYDDNDQLLKSANLPVFVKKKGMSTSKPLGTSNMPVSQGDSTERKWVYTVSREPALAADCMDMNRPECQKNCTNCQEGCNLVYGNCTKCMPGYMSPSNGCSEQCDSMYYGQDCLGDCFKTCGGECEDHVTGKCSSKTLYYILLLLLLFLLTLFLIYCLLSVTTGCLHLKAEYTHFKQSFSICPGKQKKKTGCYYKNCKRRRSCLKDW